MLVLSGFGIKLPSGFFITADCGMLCAHDHSGTIPVHEDLSLREHFPCAGMFITSLVIFSPGNFTNGCFMRVAKSKEELMVVL